MSQPTDYELRVLARFGAAVLRDPFVKATEMGRVAWRRYCVASRDVPDEVVAALAEEAAE